MAKPHTAACSHQCSGTEKRIESVKLRKFMIWDREWIPYFVLIIKLLLIGRQIFIHLWGSRALSKWSYGKTNPITLDVVSPPPSLQIYCWACCHMVWNGHLVNKAVRDVPPRNVLCIHSLVDVKNRKGLFTDKPYSAITKTSLCCQQLFNSRLKTFQYTRYYEKKLTLSWPKPVQRYYELR